MSLFNIFKKQPPLQIGEVRGDRIGCYLLTIEPSDGIAPSHHSLATSRTELIADCIVFFTSLGNIKKELISRGGPTSFRHAQELKVIENAINNLPLFVDMHLKQNSPEPFFEFPGIRIFLRTGERARQKIHNKFIE